MCICVIAGETHGGGECTMEEEQGKMKVVVMGRRREIRRSGKKCKQREVKSNK